MFSFPLEMHLVRLVNLKSSNFPHILDHIQAQPALLLYLLFVLEQHVAEKLVADCNDADELVVVPPLAEVLFSSQSSHTCKKSVGVCQ